MTVTKKLIGRLPILIGEYDGTKAYNKKQRVTLYGSEFESIVDNNTTAPATLSDNNLIINTDNWRVVSNGTEAFLAGEKVKYFNEQDNPEFISAKVDEDNKLLETTDVKGDKTFYNDVEIKGDTNIKGNLNIKNTNIYDSLEKRVEKEDGKSLIDENIAENLTAKDNPEYLEIKVDNNGKIISGRDINGILYENVGIKTKHLEAASIGDKTIGTIEEALKSNGFNHQFADWSDASEIHIPIPRCAYINITSSDGTPATWAASKTDNKKYWLQFWDMQGNYFKKRVVFNAQGNSSMNYPKKNGAIDICNDEWEGEDTCSITFGDWVAQDSFHLKSFYNEPFRGMGEVAYEFYEQQINTLGIFNNRAYKKDYSSKYTQAESGRGNSDDYTEDSLKINMLQNARCFPKAFPCVVYLNGAFYGLYSFQLKKHRDNFFMDKSKSKEIHLDGTIATTTMWNGVVNWEAFEIRNPKSLILTDGSKYNGDSPKEIIDETSEKYDSTNKNHVTTSYVKSYIKSLSNYIPELIKLESDNANSDTLNNTMRAAIAERFNVQYCIEYICFTNFMGDADAYDKNWQWTTWDGKIWNPNPYDLDSLFGYTFEGTTNGAYRQWLMGNHSPATSSSSPTVAGNPCYWVYKYYMPEIKARWKELRDSGIYTAEHYCEMLSSWMQRFGYDNYKKEYDKWNESPSNRPSYINTEYWTSQAMTSTTLDSTADYNSNTAYKVGDLVKYGKTSKYGFKCIKECTGQPPIIKFYTLYPYARGCYDSIYRVYNWIVRQLNFLDSQFDYKKVS